MNKSFVYYGLRISFMCMMFFWSLFVIFPVTNKEDVIIIISSLLFIIFVFSTFIISIIHLTKYEEKTLAIIALVISSIGLFSVLFP